MMQYRSSGGPNKHRSPMPCVCVCVVGTMKSAGSENERPKCLDQKMQAHGCCTHRVA